MSNLHYTLITDGRSDRALMPILNWLLFDLGFKYEIKGTWADLGKYPQEPKSLLGKITIALDLYPCDLLFVHRDVEKEPRKNRVEEINRAVTKANLDNFPVICVIPVRMLEAWLLLNEAAIRKAAGNSNGKSKILLPGMNKVENSPDPKDTLLEFLETASELKGTRLKKFNPRAKIHRLADVIKDFFPLYQLSAFQALKQELSEKLSNLGWL